MLSSGNSALFWEIYCMMCQWEARVEALVPFTGVEPVPVQPGQRIAGFWEDYICPEHFQTARRILRLREEGSDLDTAYEQYFSGHVFLAPIPVCPICRKPMQGGQALTSLPFQVDAQIEAQTWLQQKLGNLHRLALAEQQVMAQGDRRADEVTQLLQAEYHITLTFYRSYCQQLHLDTERTQLLESVPQTPSEWITAIEEMLDSTQHQLTRLAKRKQAEARKTPGNCPRCHHQSVYLRRMKTT